MSDKLTISAAISILLMAAYALLGAESVRLPLGPASQVQGGDAVSAPLEIAAPALPDAGDILPILR